MITKKAIKVLIVDDHGLIRSGLKTLLDSAEDIEVIGDVGTGEDAIEFTKEHQPNVIVMDIRMPGIGGLEATRKIAHAFPESRILALSSCDEEPFPSALLEVGATGFLGKGRSDAEMLTAVRAVASGQQYLSLETAQAIEERMRAPEGGSPFNTLSIKELQVALMLIGGKKNKHIADKMYIEPKTVSTYRSRIYKKMLITTDVELTLLALRHGIVDDIQLAEE